MGLWVNSRRKKSLKATLTLEIQQQGWMCCFFANESAVPPFCSFFSFSWKGACMWSSCIAVATVFALMNKQPNPRLQWCRTVFMIFYCLRHRHQPCEEHQNTLFFMLMESLKKHTESFFKWYLVSIKSFTFQDLKYLLPRKYSAHPIAPIIFFDKLTYTQSVLRYSYFEKRISAITRYSHNQNRITCKL